MTLLKRKQVFVEAKRADGSDRGALEISKWVNDRGGKAIALLKGQTDISSEFAAVRLLDNSLTNLVVPGFWIVNLENGKFVAVPDSIMMDAYDIVKEENYAPVSETEPDNSSGAA